MMRPTTTTTYTIAEEQIIGLTKGIIYKGLNRWSTVILTKEDNQRKETTALLDWPHT